MKTAKNSAKKQPVGVEAAKPKRVAILTDREREVLKLYAAGRKANGIGEELELSPKTVGSYLQRVREKFRVKDRVALIQLAIDQGLFESK